MSRSTGIPVSKRIEHNIRPISENDISAYQALRLSGLQECPEAFGESAEHFLTVTPEQIISRLKASGARGGFILGAFLPDNSLIGVVGFARQEAEKMAHRGLIWGMYVSPGARKKGIGRDLLAECVARAGDIAGVEQIHLGVVKSNEAAVELYRSLGFETYGEDPNVLKIGEMRHSEYLMVKFL